MGILTWRKTWRDTPALYRIQKLKFCILLKKLLLNNNAKDMLRNFFDGDYILLLMSYYS